MSSTIQMQQFNQRLIAEYRANGSTVTGYGWEPPRDHRVLKRIG